ncbi:MAG: hypothetical protein AB7M12_02945 [Hyphomonadaceae bacterium]
MDNTDTAKDAAGEARAAMDHATAAVVEKSKKILAHAPGFIREQARERPLRTTALALGAGVAAALMMKAAQPKRRPGLFR